MSMISILEHNIEKKKISKIWIINNKNNNEYIERTNDNNIQINIGKTEGKKLLLKIICFIAQKNIDTPFYIILTIYNINIRQIILSFIQNKQQRDNIFTHMMRYIIFITERQYNTLTQNNHLNLINSHI